MIRTRVWAALAAVGVVMGCSDGTPTSIAVVDGAQFAKGGGGGSPAVQKVDFTISDAGTGLTSDGKGIYRNAVCGVIGTWQDILHMAPAEGSIPKNQKAACTGIAPRTATLTLAVRHISDNPHVDEVVSPAGSGSWPVANVKFGFGVNEATTVNAAGSCGTVGLRFSPNAYPGSSATIRTDLGGGQWHMYTQPWPNNIGYCANGSTVTYWHVSLDMIVQVVAG